MLGLPVDPTDVLAEHADDSSWIPPRNSTTVMSDGQPRLPPAGSSTLARTTHSPNANDAAVTKSPHWTARRNGRSEKLVMPSTASRSIFATV